LKLKKLLLASSLSLLAVSATFATPAKSEVMATGALVSMCKNKANAAEQNFCHGYSQGVYDMYLASRHPVKNPAFVCFSNPGPSRNDVIGSFVGWAEINTQFSKMPAADSMMRFLASTYPCKQ
jgi:hypothetical protein